LFQLLLSHQLVQNAPVASISLSMFKEAGVNSSAFSLQEDGPLKNEVWVQESYAASNRTIRFVETR